ncbi:ABC transporter G family member 20-like [Dysidea avara]|uniref:ABC transporter G family member 20-like n=1 Tax=Dysidea avara TaxID=196820 RepID=UPI00332A1DCB
MSAYSENELAIQVTNVYKQYGRGRKAQKVLKGINMDVPYHSIYALLGASGCGKTTLLRCCLGFLRQNSGVITVLGKYPGSRGGNHIPGRDLGYMPQDIGLVPQFSIMETMYFFGVMFHMGFKQIRERANFLRNLLELPPLKKRINEMSGGEQRRVSFAVSLIQEPPMMILDEPTVGMDSLLRQSVWQYIGELTVAKQCTVIITTHYIDEARRANTVGLMRGGKLLTQSKPEDLIRAYNAVTLEEVFVKLAYKQAEDDEKAAYLDPSARTVDTKASIQTSDDDKERVDVTKKMAFCDNFFPRFLWGFHAAIIIAIALKTTIKTMRSPGSLLFLLTIPTCIAVGFIFFIGRDVKNVKLYYHSSDKATLPVLNRTYAEIFTESLDTANTFDAERATTFGEAIDKIDDGEAYFGLYINTTFSDSLYYRYYERCEAMLNGAGYPDFETIRQSTIQLAVDNTNVQLFQQGEIVLNAKGRRMLDFFFQETFQLTYEQVARPPVLLTREVFGSTSWEYSDFIGSSSLTAIVFFNSIAMTAMAFVVERKEGLFERAYSAGASVTDFVFAFSLHASIILVLQVVVLMLVVFAAFGIEMEGNIFLYGLIVWICSMLSSGIGEWYLVYTHTHTRTNCTLETDTHTHAYTCCNSVFTSGLVLSGQVTDELGAQNMAQMIGGINIFLCGALWPINGQPVFLRYISKGLPPTWPTSAAASIGARGLGLGDEPVYTGFLVALGWAIVIYFVAIAFFRSE